MFCPAHSSVLIHTYRTDPVMCSRACPSWGCAKLHSPTQDLRLSFALDNTSLAASTTFAWSSPDLNLASLNVSGNQQASG